MSADKLKKKQWNESSKKFDGEFYSFNNTRTEMVQVKADGDWAEEIRTNYYNMCESDDDEEVIVEEQVRKPVIAGKRKHGKITYPFWAYQKGLVK